jgi:hypothetical protein
MGHIPAPTYLEGSIVINPLRRRNRGLTPEQSEEVQKLVFELVRERLSAAFGANGMWTVEMKDRNAVDSIFSATVAEALAWDIAAQLAQPKKKNKKHQAAAESKPSRAAQPVATPAVTPSTVTPTAPSIWAPKPAVAQPAEEERLVA